MPSLENYPPEILSAHRLDKRLRCGGFQPRPFGHSTPGGGALDETAAEHTRLAGGCIVEHTGLPRGDALFARDQFDLIAAVFGRAQPRRLRRTGRSYPHENLQTLADHPIESAGGGPTRAAPHTTVPPKRCPIPGAARR